MGGLRWKTWIFRRSPEGLLWKKINEKHYFMKKMTNQFPRSLDLNRGSLVMLLIQASQELLIQPSVLELIGDKLHQAKQQAMNQEPRYQIERPAFYLAVEQHKA